MKLRRTFRERIRWCKNDRLPGQTLKRKKWIFAVIVLICASFDVLLLFITEKAVVPLLEDTPYLLKEYAQAYTHLATFRKDSHQRYREIVYVIAFSPDGQILAAGGRREVRLWNVSTGNPLSILKPITALEFSPDSTKLLIVSEQGFTDVYDSVTGHRKEFSRSLFVHNAIRNTYQFSTLAFSPDDKIFATGSRDPNL